MISNLNSTGATNGALNRPLQCIFLALFVLARCTNLNFNIVTADAFVLLAPSTRNHHQYHQSSNNPHSFRSSPSCLLSKSTSTKRAPSRVVDEDGPTPEPETYEAETIDPNDIPEMHYDPNQHPVPYQPWRRGTTEGCHDPIEAEWRREAERIIHKAAEMVGGRILDVTWYLTQVVLTVDPSSLPDVDEYTTGPEIDTIDDQDGPEFFDPDDPTPEPIWADEEEYMYERDLEGEQRMKESLYARKDDDDDDMSVEEELEQDKKHVPLFLEKETREDMAAMTDEEEARLESMEREADTDVFETDSAALSTIARSVLQALETVEDDLRILERHEVIMTEPGAPYVLESQAEFDVHRGHFVMVETHDPFGSNRTLKGKLLDRNAMDVIINQKGRMVTIPYNFIRSVRLRRDDDYYENEEED